jgi:gamma-glutamylcyclotransferase (GGCT)/AIG2-like uncharacterized protein YtfP
MLLFVYGTLKRGKRLHPYFRTLRPKFISDGYVEDFALYYSGVPMAVRSFGGVKLKGEVYEVNAMAILALDFVETGYKRIFVTVTSAVQKMFPEVMVAYMYEWHIRPNKFDPRDERMRVPNDCF